MGGSVPNGVLMQFGNCLVSTVEDEFCLNMGKLALPATASDRDKFEFWSVPMLIQAPTEGMGDEFQKCVQEYVRQNGTPYLE